MLHMFRGDDEVIAFLKKRDKVQAKHRSSRAYAQTAIRALAGNYSRYVEMGKFLIFIAFNMLRVDSKQFEVLVEEDACTRTTLAVDRVDALPGKISQRLDMLGIAGSDDQVLLTKDQPDHTDGGIRQEFPDTLDVVLTGLRVEQMAARDVGFPSTQGDQTTDAAEVCGRVADSVSGEVLRNQVNGEVVGADQEQRTLDLLHRSVYTHLDKVARANLLDTSRNLDYAICAYQRTDDTCTVGERCSNHILANNSERHAHVLQVTQGGMNLLRHLRGDDGRFILASPSTSAAQTSAKLGISFSLPTTTYSASCFATSTV